MIRNRLAAAVGVSALMLVLIAGLLPREYLANDDIGFTEYLRQDTWTPWISPLLVRAFCWAYQVASGVPWFGLYQYLLIFVTGVVLVHTCLELVDTRPGFGHAVTVAGAMVFVASHAILVVGITWTTVSISALGTSLAAFVAHVQRCEADRTPISVLRSAIYGLLFVCGYALRQQGLGAVVVALAPLVGWTAVRLWRRRYLPSPRAVFAFVAPFVVVFVVQDHIPKARGDDATWFKAWTDKRGAIHGHTAFEGLDTRAPELVKKAGWTVEEYRDFTSWLILDEDQYSSEKIDRLLATGGVPESMSVKWSYRQLHDIFEGAPASVMLFALTVLACVVLAARRIVRSRSGLAYALGYLVFLIGVPVYMSAHYRFPQRVSLSFYTVAALGVFVYLARAIADSKTQPTRAAVDRRMIVGLSIVGVFALGWAWFMFLWLDRDITPYRDARQQLEDRVAARGGFVFVYVQHGLVELDPLRARPRDYDGLEGGWGTFSFTWYETLERLGVHRGGDALAKMLDNPSAYIMAQDAAREFLQDWIRRKLGNSQVRLALVDSAAMPGYGRPQLFRLVTKPLTPGDEEWHALERDSQAISSFLPGPPDVDRLSFQPVHFDAPLDRYRAVTSEGRATISISPVAGGVRGTVRDAFVETTSTLDDIEPGYVAGIRIPVSGLAAARVQLALVDPDNIISVQVAARTTSTKSVRWRWRLSEDERRFARVSSFTLVPGYGAHQLLLGARSARPEDIVELGFYIEVKPGTTASFELHAVETAQP